ncbi:hypothetical protein pb186bvf_017970 [Paramecium bursaria]
MLLNEITNQVIFNALYLSIQIDNFFSRASHPKNLIRVNQQYIIIRMKIKILFN